MVQPLHWWRMHERPQYLLYEQTSNVWVVSNATISFTHLTQANSHITGIDCVKARRMSTANRTGMYNNTKKLQLSRTNKLVVALYPFMYRRERIENFLKLQYAPYWRSSIKSAHRCSTCVCVCVMPMRNLWHNVFFWQTALLSFVCLSYETWSPFETFCKGVNEMREYEFCFVTNVRIIFYNIWYWIWIESGTLQ